MKKITNIIIISILVFTLTGCGKIEEVTCTRIEDERFEQKIIYTFKGNKVIKEITETTITYESEEKAQEREEAALEYEKLYTTADITYEHHLNGNVFYEKITTNIEMLDKKTIEELELNKKRDEILYELDRYYTCK